eukprot:SAG22_NODE_10521_length_530_cov_0.721578_2_plen_61_part_01
MLRKVIVDEDVPEQHLVLLVLPPVAVPADRRADALELCFRQAQPFLIKGRGPQVPERALGR